MTENPDSPGNRQNIWIRAIFMLLLALALHLSGAVLFFATIIQFLIVLLNSTPNTRLVSFGRSIGNYMRQIVNFLTFATEEIPFSFSEWPAGE